MRLETCLGTGARSQGIREKDCLNVIIIRNLRIRRVYKEQDTIRCRRLKRKTSKKTQAINLFSGTIKVVSYLLKAEVPHPLCALRILKKTI